MRVSYLKQMRVQERRFYLTPVEIRNLFERLNENIQHATNVRRKQFHYLFKLLCEVLLHTGMRREEGLRLRPEQIDYNRNVIIVERTKGKKVREIPMTQRVRAILQELGPDLFKGLAPVTAGHKFTSVARAIGLPNMKLHSLRHTFATLLIAMGYDIKVVKDLLGHEDIRMTEIYAKTGSKILQRAVKSLDILSQRGYDLVTREIPQLPGGTKNG